MSMRVHSEQRTETTRRRLCDAAIEVLAEHGVREASFVKVCEKAGLSRGAIHHHYESMPELLADVVREIYDRLFTRVIGELPAADTGKNGLPDAIDTLWSHLQSPVFRVLLDIRAAMMSDPELASAVAGPHDRINREIITRTLERYGGTLDEATVRIILAALTGFALQFFTLAHEPGSRPQAYISEFLPMLKEFVRKRGH